MHRTVKDSFIGELDIGNNIAAISEWGRRPPPPGHRGAKLMNRSCGGRSICQPAVWTLSTFFIAIYNLEKTEPLCFIELYQQRGPAADPAWKYILSNSSDARPNCIFAIGFYDPFYMHRLRLLCINLVIRSRFSRAESTDKCIEYMSDAVCHSRQVYRISERRVARYVTADKCIEYLSDAVCHVDKCTEYLSGAVCHVDKCTEYLSGAVCHSRQVYRNSERREYRAARYVTADKCTEYLSGTVCHSRQVYRISERRAARYVTADKCIEYLSGAVCHSRQVYRISERRAARYVTADKCIEYLSGAVCHSRQVYRISERRGMSQQTSYVTADKCIEYLSGNPGSRASDNVRPSCPPSWALRITAYHYVKLGPLPLLCRAVALSLNIKGFNTHRAGLKLTKSSSGVRHDLERRMVG
ncbi:hypothetical protein J6590_013395 [Homalodisca vitripennis]|nr:hypothetical protein J6590_013395 [Homalodisca vitripennis]